MEPKPSIKETEEGEDEGLGLEIRQVSSLKKAEPKKKKNLFNNKIIISI
jgi:hypothetical protein